MHLKFYLFFTLSAGALALGSNWAEERSTNASDASQVSSLEGMGRKVLNSLMSNTQRPSGASAKVARDVAVVQPQKAIDETGQLNEGLGSAGLTIETIDAIDASDITVQDSLKEKRPHDKRLTGGKRTKEAKALVIEAIPSEKKAN